MGEESTARSYFENALTNSPDAMDVYNEIIHAWFDVDEPDKAWDTLERAEAAIKNLPYEFYLAQASYCITDYEDEIVRPWLERAVEKAPADAPVLAAIGEMAVMIGALEIGREYLERAIEADQEPGQMLLMLGILSAKEGDKQMAERYWKEAEKIARRDRDRDLQQRVKTARVVFTAPPGLADLMMRLGQGPFGGTSFPDFPDDEYDDDDDFFFDV
jgi:tetratricopeptide (TPR) repeat protein